MSRKLEQRRKQVRLSAPDVCGFLHEFLKRLFFRQRVEKGDEIDLFARVQVETAQNPFTSGVQPFLVDRRVVVGDVVERLRGCRRACRAR